MVNCDRCHRKFLSYAALNQHYDRKHPTAKKPSYLEAGAYKERELEVKPRFNPYSHRGSSVKLGVFVLILIIAAGVVAYAALTPRGPGGGKTVDVGSIAPDFRLTDTTGNSFALSDYRGKSNVLLFFNEGLACAPCLQQMQSMDQLNQQFTSLNVAMASITADDPSSLSNWARASGPTYGRVMTDRSLQVARAYDMLGYSMHGTAPGHSFVLVNTSGIVAWRQDYYPPSMWVEPSQVLTGVTKALGA